MREISENVQLENGEVMLLKYYSTSYNNDGSESYGVAVEKWQDGQMVERDESGGICETMEGTYAYLEMLHKESASPLSLGELVDELHSISEGKPSEVSSTQGIEA